jgi:hypothetical protein
MLPPFLSEPPLPVTLRWFSPKNTAAAAEAAFVLFRTCTLEGHRNMRANCRSGEPRSGADRATQPVGPDGATTSPTMM